VPVRVRAGEPERVTQKKSGGAREVLAMQNILRTF
jgi:hypothetical protein